MSDDLNDGDDYEVGYGKPPKQSRFKPGQSGNPRGRPIGARGTHSQLQAWSQPSREMILRELYEPVTIKEGGRVYKVTGVQAVVKATKKSALMGSAMAQRTALSLVKQLEDEAAAARSRLLDGDFMVPGLLVPEAEAVIDGFLLERDQHEQGFHNMRAAWRKNPRSWMDAGLALACQNRFDAINQTIPEYWRKDLLDRLSDEEADRIREMVKVADKRRRRRRSVAPEEDSGPCSN